ncbi:MAG: hypothetical protein AAF532_11660 [Planctomycetota bacterium]
MLNPKQHRRVIAEAARRIVAGEVSHPRLAKFRAARDVVGRRCRPDELPTDGEIHAEVRLLMQPGLVTPVTVVDSDDAAGPAVDWGELNETYGSEDDEDGLPPERWEIFLGLLRPLTRVRMPPTWHPEGDALTHSLQVYALATDAIPYDEEFRLAALLHEVGRGIDSVDPVPAAVDELADLVTPRTLWFVEHLSDALKLARGESGARTRRRLAASEDFETLRTLADCDRAGRKRGMAVPLVEDVLDELAGT